MPALYSEERHYLYLPIVLAVQKALKFSLEQKAVGTSLPRGAERQDTMGNFSYQSFEISLVLCDNF